ncbi:MAG: hypothetical protein M9894_36625 [Planctomycetes bacterium]|nr:hypothetical protein [Planctomycetota bacterium]
MDDRLRGLARAARADPSDGAAGRALARALEQAGDPFGAWREQCRLAAGGDARAWEELEAMPSGAREAGDVRQRTIDVDPRQLSLDGRTLLLAQRGELLVLDAGDLSTRWVASGGRALAHGPVVIHADERERAVVVRDARDGRALGRAPLERDLVPVTIAAAGGRAAVRCEREPAPGQPPVEGVTLVVDIAAAVGAVLARHPEPPPTVGVVRGVRLVHADDDALEARDLVSDRPVHAPLAGWRWLDDQGGELLACGRDAGSDLRLVDAVTRHERWVSAAGVDRIDAAALTADSVVLLEAGAAVVGRSRRTGLRRWTLPPPPGEAAALAASADVVYLSTWREHATTVQAIDARDGRPLWRRELPHPDDLVGEAPLRGLSAWPCPGGVVLAAWRSGRLHLVRLGAD